MRIHKDIDTFYRQLSTSQFISLKHNKLNVDRLDRYDYICRQTMGKDTKTRMAKINLRIFYLLSLLCSTVFAGPVKTVYSITNNGSVTSGSDWSLTAGGAACGCTPDFSKDIININTNISAASAITVQNGATLNVNNNATFLVSGKLTFNNGSIVNVAAGSTLNATGDIENKNNSNQITINGNLTGDGNFIGGNGSTLTGSGNLTVDGTATLTGGSVFGSTTSCTSAPCTASASNPLPVDLLFFEGRLNDFFNVELSWSTGSESNNAYFSIERSKDGVFFESLDKVNGQGNSNQVSNYNIVDNAPLPGISYYRLKQVDFDGKTSFSNLIAINSNAENSSLECFGISVFPNPSTTAASIAFKNLKEETQLFIQVYDFTGRIIFTDFITARNGTVTTIDVSNFESGIYFVNARLNEQSVTEKIAISSK